MRVLLIIPTLDQGGAEKQLSLLASRLPRSGFDVHVCVLTRSGPLHKLLDESGIPVHQIRKRWKLDPAAYLRTKKTIQSLRPDLVHTWIFAANCYGRHAALSAGVRCVIGGERCVDRWKAWHEFAIDRYLARHSRCVVVNSPGVRDFYAGKGIPIDKLAVVPNGIPEFVPSESVDREALLRELRIPSGSRLIGAVGRLWPQKRIKDLIWAADLLKVIRDDTHLLIIGDGPQQWRLMRYRDQVRIQDRVHFLGHRSDVPRLLEHLDCLWLASGYEGQSNAIMEGMAAGKPVVATDIVGNRDLIQSEINGILVPVGDRAAFARRTNQLLDDPALAVQLSQSAQGRMREHFSVESMVGRYAELYERLVDT